MTNAVKSSSPAMRLSNDVLEHISGFTWYYECPGTMPVCKAWSRIFTPYNVMQNNNEMTLEWLATTCPPRNRQGVYYRGVEYDMEHSNLRFSRAYQILTNAQNKGFSSLSLGFPLPGHDELATALFKTGQLSSLNHLTLNSVPSRALLQGLHEGCPNLESMWIGNFSAIGAEALCDELNKCSSLKETTINAKLSDGDLEKLQNLQSLTQLHVHVVEGAATPDGLRHLADGYPALRKLCISGGVALLGQPTHLARPWVQRFVELESLATRLQSLRLECLTKAESSCVATYFLSKASMLQALEFQCSDLDPECIKPLPKCPSLTDLNLSCDNKGVTDATIQTVAQCAKLRFLSIEFRDDIDRGKAVQHLAGHKALEDLTLQEFSPKDSDRVVSLVKTLLALRVLELARDLHTLVVSQLPHHNVYAKSHGPSREKYKFVPEKPESKKGS